MFLTFLFCGYPRVMRYQPYNSVCQANVSSFPAVILPHSVNIPQNDQSVPKTYTYVS